VPRYHSAEAYVVKLRIASDPRNPGGSMTAASERVPGHEIRSVYISYHGMGFVEIDQIAQSTGRPEER
jgi:hypothetical protein